jgi:hypothetical protein
MKPTALDDLRARVSVIEGGRDSAVRTVPLGAPVIDAVLPGGGLRGAAGRFGFDPAAVLLRDDHPLKFFEIRLYT